MALDLPSPRDKVCWTEAGGNAGSVSVYDWDGAQWSIMPGTPVLGEYSTHEIGRAVKLNGDGTRLLYTSQGDKNLHIYDYDGSTWSFLTSTDPHEERDNYGFGDQVRITRDGTKAMTMLGHDTNGARVYTPPMPAPPAPPAPPPATGKVHLYDWDEASGNWTELPLSPLKGDAAGDLFGYWLAMSDDGKTLSVGAPGRSDDEGYARVFTLGVETLSRIYAPPSPPVLRGGAAGHVGAPVL